MADSIVYGNSEPGQPGISSSAPRADSCAYVGGAIERLHYKLNQEQAILNILIDWTCVMEPVKPLPETDVENAVCRLQDIAVSCVGLGDEAFSDNHDHPVNRHLLQIASLLALLQRQFENAVLVFKSGVLCDFFGALDEQIDELRAALEATGDSPINGGVPATTKTHTPERTVHHG